MKKLILAICLAVLSVGAYASGPASVTQPIAQAQNVGASNVYKHSNYFVAADYTFTSSCGTVWTVTAPDDAPASAHYALWAKMEAACGTDITYVEVLY